MNSDNVSQAWLVICLLCAFMLITNLTLVSLWRHRHEKPTTRTTSPPSLTWPKAPWSEENAQWQRLRETVRSLPHATTSATNTQQIEQEYTKNSQSHSPEE